MAERGYDAVTMHDVAAAASVAKGTIYEHWSTREELFVALVGREQDALADQLTDARDTTLSDLIRNAALALLQRPLLVAILIDDSAVWGKLLKQLPGSRSYQGRIASFEAFLTDLRQRGQIRTDQSLSEQVHVVTGVLAGFVMARGLIPHRHHIDDEALATIMADTIALTFESTDQSVPTEAAARLLAAGRKARA